MEYRNGNQERYFKVEPERPRDNNGRTGRSYDECKKCGRSKITNSSPLCRNCKL